MDFPFREKEKIQIKNSDIRRTAMNLLSRREHALKELATKLFLRFPEKNQIEAVLQKLCDEGLQSDSRYCEAFFRQRVAQGYGLLRIRRELQERGVAESLIEHFVAEVMYDWFQLCLQAKQKKFGTCSPESIKEEAKWGRFLLYRGFDDESVRKVLLGRERLF